MKMRLYADTKKRLIKYNELSFRKRDRSPSSDCDDCLPISKRITRLNIQASRQSLEDKESYPCSTHQNGRVPVSPETSLQWQQNQSYMHQGNNNNLNRGPCGSSQCDSSDSSKNGLQAYANHYGLPCDDLNGYKPELSERQNPYYFQINSVLYRAHLDKASRQGLDLKK